MLDEEDLTALLGKNLDLTELTSALTTQPKAELAKIEPDHLEEKILAESNDILEKTKYAVADVLMLDNLHKIYAMKEKFKQQVILQGIKINAADKMNQDNNSTKILLTREQILSTLDKNSSEKDVIEVSDEENNKEPKLMGINDIQK